MITKIKNALSTEYAKLGVSDKAFDGVASFLAKTVTKEEEIGDIIKSEDVRNLLKAFQGESDSLRNKNAQLQKQLDALKQNSPKPEEKPALETQEADEPAWFKAYREKQEKLVDNLSRQLEETKQRSRTAAVRERCEKAGCLNKRLLDLSMKGFSFNDGESVEDAAARVKAEYDSIFSDGVVPPVGMGAQVTDEKGLKSRLSAFADRKGLKGNEE